MADQEGEYAMPKHVFFGMVAALVGMGLFAQKSFSQANANVVISQIYGGGGLSGATYTNDFIEIYNRTTSSVDISGWSIQYATSIGTSWTTATVPASTTLLSGQYYLFQLGSNGAIGSSLPTPNVTSGINLAASNGKIALTSDNTNLSGQFATGTGPTIVDFVGYGSNANGFEGTGFAPSTSATNSIFRLTGGLTDTGVNSADFTSAIPSPRNSSNFQPVPEPASLLLTAAGLGLVGVVRRRRTA